MCYPVDFQDGVEMTWNKLPTSVIWDLADNVMTHQKAYKNLSQGFQMKLGLEDSVRALTRLKSLFNVSFSSSPIFHTDSNT